MDSYDDCDKCELMLAKILEDSIRIITPKLDSMSIKELIKLREMEEGGKNRKTLLKAIDKMRSKFWRKWCPNL